MKYFLMFFGIVFSLKCIAQQHDKNWLMTHQYGAYSGKLNFSPNLTVDTIIRNMPISGANISMSDSLGNLLFYSNGIKIHSAQYLLMQNGDSLNPGQLANNNNSIGYPYNESMASIPHPTKPNKYYIFHQMASYSSLIDGFSEKLYFTLIDMNANGGLGRVEQKNQPLLENDSMCVGQLEVVKHGNGRDWWLIQPMAYSNGYHIFLISENSITYHHKQYIGNISLFDSEFIGQAIFSHQGDKYFRYDYKNDFDIFDFDRCTGYLSNYQHIPIQDSVDNVVNGGFFTGVAISPNDRYVYLSSYIYMYQFDLLAPNIAASKDTIGVYDGYVHGSSTTTFFSTIQSAPDGKIYSMVSGTPYLHVIDDPDIGGLGCNVIQRGIDIKYSNNFIPNMPHYRTPVLSGSACDTLTSVTDIKEKATAIQLYPNPTNNNITIETTEPIERVILYNALGQQVMTQTGNKQQLLEIETKGLENGTYFVSIWMNGEVVNRQFQVQH